MNEAHRPLALLVARVLLAPIFLYASIGHLLQPEKIAARLDAAELGWLATSLAPSIPLVILSGLVMLIAGATLLVGFQTRLSAALLAVVLIPITVSVQVGNPAGWGPFFKNVAIFGGLIQFAWLGADSWSVDALLSRRRSSNGRSAGRSSIVAGVSTLLVAALAFPALAVPDSKETTEPVPRRVAFLVLAPRPLKNVLATAQGIRKEGAEVTVMVCGQAVASLISGGANETASNAASDDGVRVVACGLTLTELSVAEEKLTRGVEVVPNGLLEMLRLQEQGYRTVDL